jgi:2-keto-4-pentenoate hydratase
VTPRQRRDCADLLARARLGGPPTAAPPPELLPAGEDDGYAVQAELNAILAQEGYGAVVGHKIGCTTKVMQAFLKIAQPCAGEVFERTVHRESAELPLGRYHRIGVECEIAARLGADLLAEDAPFTRASVTPAVGALMAGIELVDDRYVDYPSLSAPVLIADDFFNAGVVLGPPVADWHELDLAAIEGSMTVDGSVVGSGTGADILGHPLEALAWLATMRARRGHPLRAGSFVMLGSVVKTVFLDRPTHVMVALSGLGRAEVRFV